MILQKLDMAKHTVTSTRQNTLSQTHGKTHCHKL